VEDALITASVNPATTKSMALSVSQAQPTDREAHFIDMKPNSQYRHGLQRLRRWVKLPGKLCNIL